MTYRLQRIEVPDESTESLAGALRQFFKNNPSITLLDVSLRIEERAGWWKALVWVSYDTDGSQTYDAVEFIDGTNSTDSQAATFFGAVPSRNPIRVFITTRFSQRLNVGKRLLIIYEDRYAATRAQSTWLVGGEAAELVVNTGQALQPSGESFGADRLLVTNVGGGPWPPESEAPVVGTPGGPIVVGPGCESSGANNLGILPVGPSPVVCSGVGPTQDPPPPPPPNGNCCLKAVYTCECPDTVTPQWKLTSAECVSNALCDVFVEECDGGTTYTYERQNACFCGQALPDPLPQPTCDPNCCPAPPPKPDCCLSAQFDCLCDLTDSSGNPFPYWSLTSIACQTNATCTKDFSYQALDTDADGGLDRVVYQERGGCDCGDIGAGASTLLPELKANQPALFGDGDPAPPEPEVAPFATPDCCPDNGCCVQLRYLCQQSSGDTSTWVFLDATCLTNDQCSSSGTTPEEPVRVCGAAGVGQVATVTLRDGCDCADLGALSQQEAEAVLPGEPVGCVADCATTGRCCAEIIYECQDLGGASTWVFQSAACLDNEDCTSSGTDPETIVRVCDGAGAGQEARVSLRDGCDCADRGALTQAAAEAILPGEPVGCTADCVAAVPCGTAPDPAPSNTSTATFTFDIFGGDQSQQEVAETDGIIYSNSYIGAGVRVTADDYAALVAASGTGNVYLVVEDFCAGNWVDIEITGAGDFETPLSSVASGDGTGCVCSPCISIVMQDFPGPVDPGGIIAPGVNMDGVEGCLQQWWDIA